MNKIYLLIWVLLISSTLLKAQTRVITGTVTGSEDSKPVIGTAADATAYLALPAVSCHGK